MNVDVRKISELYNKLSIDKDSVKKIGKNGVIDMSEHFDDESKIQHTENILDAYDRGTTEKSLDEEKFVLNEEVLKKLGELVNTDNYSMYEELGIIPDQDDPSNILTVSERIEIELATHCDNYRPTGRISIKDLENMYGSSGRAYQIANRLNDNNIYPKEELVSDINQALDKIDSIKEISREASEYLLTNNKSVSIENVYKAVYSVSDFSSTTYEKLNEEDWSKLQGQVKSSVESMGFEADEETMQDARWLIESKIPINSSNIYKLSVIRDINTQIKNENISVEEWTDKLYSDKMLLSTAGSSSMDFYKTVKGDSIEAVTILENGTPQQINELLTDGKEVNLLNLKKLQEDNSKNSQQERKEYSESQYVKEQKFISAKRTLEEARLKMSVEAGAMLIRNGFELNIASLTDIVEELKAMENEVSKAVFDGVGYVADKEELEMYSDSLRYIKDFASTNAYVLGNVYKQEIEFNIKDVVDTGKINESLLKSAYESYDMLGTKPDKMLGDSISKAFANMDSLLEELGIENSELNKRAVRILSYNQIEINVENLEKIKEMDSEVTRLIDNLSPRMTAYLISNGINPLNTNISKLNKELEDIKDKLGDTEIEEYSEYLWKLQKNNEISDEDKEAYIGVYRLLRMIEKGDRRAIGAVAKQEGDLTLKSLMTASRSIKYTGKEYTVDDDMGISEEIKLAKNNIMNQLERFLKDFDDSDETNEAYYEKLNEIKVREIENLKHISEETLINIAEDNVSGNMANIVSVSYILENSGSIYSKIRKVCDDKKVNEDIKDLSKSLEDVSEDNDETDINEKMMKLNEDVREAILNKSNISLEDIRCINASMKYMVNATKSQSYYVPLEYEGEEKLVKFTLNRDEKNKGTIGIKIFSDINTEAKIKIRDDKLNIVEYDGDYETDIENIQEKLKGVLNEGDMEINNSVMIKVAKAFIFEINNNSKKADI